MSHIEPGTGLPKVLWIEGDIILHADEHPVVMEVFDAGAKLYRLRDLNDPDRPPILITHIEACDPIFRIVYYAGDESEFKFIGD